MGRETIEVCLNGEWAEYLLYKKGDEVMNEYGDVGVVESTENGGMFVNVTWIDVPEEKIGKTWLVNGLVLVGLDQDSR